MVGSLAYIAVAAFAWPVFALVLLRRGTPETQYLQIGKAAGLALLWPPMLLVTIVGVAAVRIARSTKRRATSPRSVAVPVPAGD